jgi:hypothetical protein
MTLMSELLEIYSDLPENEKARALFEALYTLVEEGSVVAFRDENEGIIYRAQIHASRQDIARAVSLDELRAGQEEIIRQIQSQYN